jgi:hypothetical protein
VGETGWQRVAGASGIVFALLILVVAVGLAPNPPPSTASGKDVVAYVSAHRDALGLANYLGALATLFFLTFAAGLRGRLARAETDRGQLANVSFGAAVVLAALLLATASAEVAITQRALENGDVSVATLYVLSAGAGAVFFFPIAGMVAAGSASGMASRSLPPWLCWVGAIVVVVELLAGAASAVRSGALALDGAVGTAALPAFLVWTLATSIVLVVRPSSNAQVAPRA